MQLAKLYLAMVYKLFRKRKRDECIKTSNQFEKIILMKVCKSAYPIGWLSVHVALLSSLSSTGSVVISKYSFKYERTEGGWSSPMGY